MSIKYELIIYWSDEDRSFIVEVPELPGCMADGETQKEAVANVQRIIEEMGGNGESARSSDSGAQGPLDVRIGASRLKFPVIPLRVGRAQICFYLREVKGSVQPPPSLAKGD